MKTITIPTKFGYPKFDMYINGKKYTLTSGEEITVEDYVADVVENAIALAPKPERHFGRFAEFVSGNITEVKSVELEGITNISRCAFYNYDSLISIEIPDSVTSIGNEAFSDCSKLKSITFGENSQLASIEGYVFYKCLLLTNITIPNSITSIGSAAFSNCTGLKRITIKAKTPPNIKADTFSNVPTDCIFEVPSDAVEAYKTADVWSGVANQIIATKE